jgi:hypothetical protein
MNDLLSQITPSTKGIIWIPAGPIRPKTGSYDEIDYLLNGLLTLTLQSGENESLLLVGENFGHSLYVLITEEVGSKTVKNFSEVIKNHLNSENEICVIDEKNLFPALQKNSPEEIKKKFRLV